MLEKELERKLKKAVEAEGCLCLKFESPGYAGVPDRIILMPDGIALFVEMKAPGKTERPRQRYVQKKFDDLGFIVFPTIDSEEKIASVTRFVRRHAEAARRKKAKEELTRSSEPEEKGGDAE